MNVCFITHDGQEQNVTVEPGSSLMQAARDNGVDGILGDCGGACACATCRCIVDEAWTDAVGDSNPIEKHMLECVEGPQPNSRLACQIDLSEDLDGLVVRLPESQL